MSEKQQPQTLFSIQKLFVKDISFESPNTPHVFSFQKWEPKIELNLNNANNRIDENLFQAELRITVTVTHDDKTAFLIEVNQAGIFAISGFNDQDKNYLLGSQCMSILFPYARELISDLTTRGGFPPLILAPVNFDALYQQHTQQQKDNSAKAESVKH